MAAVCCELRPLRTPSLRQPSPTTLGSPWPGSHAGAARGAGRTGTWLRGTALHQGQPLNPQRVVGMEELGGSPPPCTASCANEEPPPGTAVSAGPCDPAGGGERKRPAAPPACKLLPHAGGRSRRSRGHVSPFPPCGDPAFAGLGSPTSTAAASTSAGRRHAWPQDPARSGGQQECSQSSPAPGAAPAPGHGSPTVHLDFPSRQRQGLLLKAVSAPTAPEGFNSSSSRFHNPAKPPQAARAWGDLGGSLLKLGQAETPWLGGRAGMRDGPC